MEKKGTNWLLRKTIELPSTFKKQYPIDGPLQPSYGVLEFLQIRWQANLLLGNLFSKKKKKPEDNMDFFYK